MNQQQATLPCRKDASCLCMVRAMIQSCRRGLSGLDLIIDAGVGIAQPGSAALTSSLSAKTHLLQHLGKLHEPASASTLQFSAKNVSWNDKESTVQGTCRAFGTLCGFTKGCQGALSVVSPLGQRMPGGNKEYQPLPTGTIPVWHWCAPSRKLLS